MEAEIQLAVKQVWTQYKVDQRSQGKVQSDQVHHFVNQVFLQMGVTVDVSEKEIKQICREFKNGRSQSGGLDQTMISKVIKTLLMQRASINVEYAEETDDVVEVEAGAEYGRVVYEKAKASNKIEPSHFSVDHSPQHQFMSKNRIDLSAANNVQQSQETTQALSLNIINDFKNNSQLAQNLDVELSTLKNNGEQDHNTLEEQKSARANPEYDARADYKLDSDDDQEYRKENDPTQFWSNGKWHTYSKKSMFMLNYNNKYRLRVIKIITNRRFDHVIVLLIMVNSLLLGIKDYTDDANCSAINQFVEQMEPVFMWSFLIECVLKVIGMGFILDQGSYLRDPWNWLDFIVVVSSLLTEIPSMRSVSGMRTFRLLRPLRTLTTMPSMKILISTLIDSVAQLGGVLVLAVFFFIIFAILGVSLWKGSINKRCRLTQFPMDGDWKVDGADPLLCSSQRECSVNRWCGSLAEADRSDDPRYYLNSTLIGSIYRDSEIEDLNFGFTNFDNLAVAFLTIFQCITLEGWINVCNMFEDAYDIWFVDLYFLLCIIVCSMFVLNLTIAVMLLKYEEFDKSEKGQSHDVELHEYGQKIGLPIRLVEFLIEQDNLSISKKGLATLQNEKQVSIWKQLIRSEVTFDAEDKYYNNRFTQINFIIVNSPIFNGFIILVIMMNTITLSLDQHPKLNEETLEVFGNLNVFFSIIFTVEVVLKVIGLGVREFVSDRFNLFDAAIVLISILEFIIQADGEKGGAFSALRAFRLFRILKIFRAGQLRTLLDCITFTLLSIKDYLILLILFIYVLALLGMSFFAGKVTFDEDNQYLPVGRRQTCDVDPADFGVKAESPRANFDTLLWAYLTVFEIMIGENWNGVMYDHMRAVGQQSCLFFVALVICGNIIMLNLFLAILLGNFERARTFGEKKKLFDAFESMEKLGLNLREAIQCLFDDADFSKYIDDKILMSKDESVRAEENSITDLEIMQVTQAIKNKKVKELLTGELVLEDFELDKNLAQEITESQKLRSVQIIKEIKKFKKENSEKQYYIERQSGAKGDKGTPEKNTADQEQDKSDPNENQASKSAEQTRDEKIKYYIEYLRNSSLLIFHQDGFIRKYCQLCVQSDKEQNSERKKEQLVEVNPKSADKVGEEYNTIESGKKKQALSDDLDVSVDRKVEQSSAQKSGSADRFSFSRKNNSPAQRKNMVAKMFEGVILTLIIISSISLIIDNPLQDPEADHIVFVGYMDNCFTILFTMECIIKIIAMGFILNNQAMRDRGFSPYLTNPWNMLDFVVVIASLIDFIVTVQASKQQPEDAQSSNSNASSLQSIKALRALRALRPLRMISRNKGMKLIVNALLASIPNMTNVAIVCALFLLIFAIMGVDQFKGRFWRCSIEDPAILETIITKQDCLDNDGEWINITENFDNTALGARTLFEMMSTEGWIDVMNNGIDAVGVDMQPKKDHNVYMIIYFTVFMMFGSQFILNLFVGIIMDNFNRIKDREEWGGLFVTEDQRTWIDAQRLGIVGRLTKRVEPPEGVRGKFYLLVNHPVFDGIITLIIIVNTAMMATRHDGMSPVIEDIFGYFNSLFTVVFNIEMILKLIGLDKQYFYSSWNLFDMFVVVCTNIGIILDLLELGKGFSTAGIIIRAFRIMRIIRLVRKQPDVKIILDTLVNILPQITNFIALMFLLLFIYAALGINLFGGVVQQEFITPKNNFTSIGVAIMLLFRSSTGEDWNKIMHELAIINDGNYNCIEDQTFEIIRDNNGRVRACGLQFMAQVYMLSFTFVVSWLIMNLSVAAVIEGLENAKQLNSGVITKDDQLNLIEAWQEYDPKATGWISVKDFMFLIIEQPPPFGSPELTLKCKLPGKKFQEAKTRIYNENSFLVNEKKQIIIRNKLILQQLSKMGLKQYVNCEGKLHFKEVYQTFVKEVFKEQMTDFEISQYLETKMDNEWLHKYKLLKSMPTSSYQAHENFASKIMTFYGRNLKIWRMQQKELDLQKSQQMEGIRTPNRAEHADDEICDDSRHNHSDLRAEEEDGRSIIRNKDQLRWITKNSGKKFRIGFSSTISNRDSAITYTRQDINSRYASIRSKGEQETLRLPAPQGEGFQITSNPYPNAPLTAMRGPQKLPPLKLNQNLSKEKKKSFKRVQSLQTSNKDAVSQHLAYEEQDSSYFNTKHGSIQSRMPPEDQREQIAQNQQLQKSFEDSGIQLMSPFESIKSKDNAYYNKNQVGNQKGKAKSLYGTHDSRKK